MLTRAMAEAATLTTPVTPPPVGPPPVSPPLTPPPVGPDERQTAEMPPDQPLDRPGLLGLLKYTIGLSLPAKHNSWVLHDTTCSTWVLRHLARTGAVVLPLFLLYLVVTPGSLGLRLYTGLTFAAAAFALSLVLIQIDSDKRAIRAGFRFGVVSEVRSARAIERQRTSNFERRERIAARQARRR